MPLETQRAKKKKETAKKYFPFTHLNYGGACHNEHLLLQTMEYNNHPAITESKTRGFSGSLSQGEFYQYIAI